MQRRSLYSELTFILQSLHWLPIRRRIEFKTATLCFKAVKVGTPPYLKNMLQSYEPVRSLRSSNMDLLTVPRTATTVNHKKRDILFLNITLANLNRFL